MPLTEVKPERV